MRTIIAVATLALMLATSTAWGDLKKLPPSDLENRVWEKIPVEPEYVSVVDREMAQLIAHYIRREGYPCGSVSQAAEHGRQVGYVIWCDKMTNCYEVYTSFRAYRTKTVFRKFPKCE